MDIEELYRFGEHLADAAARETLPRFRTDLDIANKDAGAFDPVTAADREAERAIRRLIEERYPDHGIKGEEFGEKKGAGRYRWILDPVDGTRAFICGIPVWTTLIGLEEDGRPAFGVVDQPYLKERWVASTLGDGPLCAFMTSGRKTLETARLMVTDMRAGEYFSEEEAASAARVAAKVQVTRQGLDSYGFALLASGRMDLVVEAGLHWHDVAAVIPVVEAAGGVVLDWQGRALADRGGTLQVIAAATPALAEAAAKVIAS